MLRNRVNNATTRRSGVSLSSNKRSKKKGGLTKLLEYNITIFFITWSFILFYLQVMTWNEETLNYSVPERNNSIRTAKMGLENSKAEKPHVHVSVRALGITKELPEEQLNENQKKTGISLVISHCESKLQWITDFIDTKVYSVNDITIYSKCGKRVKGLDDLATVAPTKVVFAENVGRCDQSYASWIQNHYNAIRKDEEDKDDIVVFLKDNQYHQDYFRTFDELFTYTTEEGFGCVEKPVCDCDNVQCNDRHDIPLMLHNQTLLDNYSMNSHTRLDRDKKRVDPFKSKEYSILKDWKDAMNFVVPRSDAVPVCYGGMFAAKKKQLLNQPIEAWQNMDKSLSRGDNIIEGHFAERMWAALLSNINEKHAQAVSEAVFQHVYDTFSCWNRKGMLLVPKEKGFSSDLFTNIV
jgi:hypothetical protein